MSTKNYVSLGIMTGTSLDGIDFSVINSDGREKIIFLGGKTFNFPRRLRESIYTILGSKKSDSVTDIVDTVYTKYVIKKIKTFIEKRNNVDIIGFHGQTITHDSNLKFTWQIGNAKKIFNSTRIVTVYNFRNNDINNGGNGAPLTPIFHLLLSKKYKIKKAAFVNLGGIANLTVIKNNNLFAFDCGPCCSISDDFAKYKANIKYDNLGILASKGKPDYRIITKLTKKDYFKKKGPKSLDRSEINIDEVYDLDLCDGLATINEFIAETIFLSLRRFKKSVDNIVFLGGGRKNRDLINRIKNKIDTSINIAEDYGIDGDLAEANAFAYLAIRSLNKSPISFPNTTGVVKAITGGELVS